jgi:hypothetical protein
MTCVAKGPVLVRSAVWDIGVSSTVRPDPGAQTALRLRPLRAALWGASGAAGSEVLRQCLTEPRIGQIVAFTRRPLAIDPRDRPRVAEVHIADFLDMSEHRDALRDVDVAFWCLGVSQLAEPKKEGYRRVTRDFALASATILREESPDATFHFLSGLGAARNGCSPVMWGRVKGEAELALARLGLGRLVVWRPTFIHAVAGRERPTRGDRMAERLYFRFIPLLTISTVNLAQAMLQSTLEGQGQGAKTYGPWQINRIARAYRASSKQGQERW